MQSAPKLKSTNMQKKSKKGIRANKIARKNSK